MKSTWYRQGETHGFKYYARNYNVYGANHRAFRTMTMEERREYDAGYDAGIGRVDGRRLEQLGYHLGD